MIIFDENNYCIQPVLNVADFSDDKIVILYPIEFIGDPVLEENIPKMIYAFPITILSQSIRI